MTLFLELQIDCNQTFGMRPVLLHGRFQNFLDCRAYMETKRLAKESEPAISYTADRLKDLNSIFEEAIGGFKYVQ